MSSFPSLTKPLARKRNCKYKIYPARADQCCHVNVGRLLVSKCYKNITISITISNIQCVISDERRQRQEGGERGCAARETDGVPARERAHCARHARLRPAAPPRHEPGRQPVRAALRTRSLHGWHRSVNI